MVLCSGGMRQDSKREAKEEEGIEMQNTLIERWESPSLDCGKGGGENKTSMQLPKTIPDTSSAPHPHQGISLPRTVLDAESMTAS